MAKTAGTVVRWTETSRGKVYFGLSTGPTVVCVHVGVFACLTCLRADCAHVRVAEVEMDRLCATGVLRSSRFAASRSDADAA